MDSQGDGDGAGIGRFNHHFTLIDSQWQVRVQSDLYLHRKAADDIRDTVLKVARRCVDEDGAEVLIAGCTLAGSVLSKAERDEPGSQPAPIIDGMLPGFKMAETMATLREAGLPPVSRLGVYQQPPVADLQKLRDFQGRPMPVWATGDRP